MAGDPLPSLGLLERRSLDLKLEGPQSCLLRGLGTGQSTVGPHGQRDEHTSHDMFSLEIPEIGSQETKEGRERPGSRVPRRRCSQ